jgi:signal transduction histidine kinase
VGLGTRIRSFALRIMPRTLRVRLTLTILLSNLVIAGVALLLVAVSLNRFDDTFLLAALAVIGVALIPSALVGISLSHAIGQPLQRLMVHVQTWGNQAIEGAPYHPSTHDPWLPVEFSNLRNTFEDLLRHLSLRQSELVLADSEATATQWTLETAVNDSPEAKLMLSEGIVVLVNPAATALFDTGRDQMIGTWLSDVLARWSIKIESDELLDGSSLVEKAHDGPVEVEMTREGHVPRIVEFRAIQHEDAEQTTLLTARDVTEQRRIESLRSEIISIVSHDLRAPLTVITGYLDLLGRPLSDEQRNKALAAARNSAEGMGVLLEDLLHAARAEAIFAPQVMSPVCMRDIAYETVTSFEHTSDQTFELDASCAGIALGEEKRLRQALVNLVSNAMKYSPVRGTILVSVRCENGRIVCAVEDDGAGVPEANRDSIFERYARIESDDKDRKGIGLGLYIVRAIAEGHGGQVSVEDARTRIGARFVLDLKSAEDDSDSA